MKGKTVVKCKECGVKVEKRNSELKRYNNAFCSKSCSTKYGNKHKLYGNHARSKFEKWLEKTIPKDFPKLKPIFNDRKVLNGLELDIYFPTLGLAFEINGPTHYIPIYGADELLLKKASDNRKKCRAYRRNITLRTINVSKGKNDIPSFIEFYKKIKLEIKEVIKNERNKFRRKS